MANSGVHTTSQFPGLEMYKFLPQNFAVYIWGDVVCMG